MSLCSQLLCRRCLLLQRPWRVRCVCVTDPIRAGDRQLVIEVPSHVASGEQIVVTVPADGGGSSAAAGAVPEANSHPQAAASQNVTMMRQAQQQQQEQEQEQAAAAAAAAAPRAAAPVAKWGKMRIDGSPSTRGHWQDAHPSAIPASDPEAMESDRAGFDWEGRGGAAAGAAGQGPGGGGRNLRPLPPLGAGKVWYRRSDCLLLQVSSHGFHLQSLWVIPAAAVS